jgi:hypothetical protein
VIAKPLKLDANKKVTAEGAAEMVRELKAAERRVALPAARFRTWDDHQGRGHPGGDGGGACRPSPRPSS